MLLLCTSLCTYSSFHTVVDTQTLVFISPIALSQDLPLGVIDCACLYLLVGSTLGLNWPTPSPPLGQKWTPERILRMVMGIVSPTQAQIWAWPQTLVALAQATTWVTHLWMRVASPTTEMWMLMAPKQGMVVHMLDETYNLMTSLEALMNGTWMILSLILMWCVGLWISFKAFAMQTWTMIPSLSTFMRGCSHLSQSPCLLARNYTYVWISTWQLQMGLRQHTRMSAQLSNDSLLMLSFCCTKNLNANLLSWQVLFPSWLTCATTFVWLTWVLSLNCSLVLYVLQLTMNHYTGQKSCLHALQASNHHTSQAPDTGPI